MGDAAAARDALEIVRLQPQAIDECVELVRTAFEEFAGSPEVVRHWFEARVLNNPWQASLDGVGVGARDQGRLVAFRAMFGQPWWLRGQPVVAAFAAHTAIDPAYRGAGLGGRLVAASREFADLTGSTTAGAVTQKIYRRQDFVAIGGDSNDFFQLRVSYAGSLRSRLGGVAGGLAGQIADRLHAGAERSLVAGAGFVLAPMTRCTPEFDLLWVQGRDAYGSCLERSSRYLNWRLFEQPTQALALLGLRDRNARLRAYGVWHEQAYSEHVRCAVLRDLFCAAGDAEAVDAFLREAVLHWRALGISWARLEVAAPALTQRFSELGFERLASNGNRYQVHHRQPLAAATVHDWYRSGLDGDHFDTRSPEGKPSEH